MLKPILLVEDNPRDLDLSLRALARTNLSNEVVVARDGEEAWEYLAREGKYANRTKGNPAVVMLDLKLPKLDGVQVLDRIRKHPEMENLPVVMLTASREQTDVARSYALGVNAYVVKPFDFTEFLEAIRELGVFWAVLNEPPPGSYRLRPSRPATQPTDVA
jgi:CheY-like chemotaxis protein